MLFQRISSNVYFVNHISCLLFIFRNFIRNCKKFSVQSHLFEIWLAIKMFVSTVFAIVIFICVKARVVERCPEGTTETVKTAIRKCKNGKWMWAACVVEDGTLLDDGDLLRKGSYLIQCQTSEDSMKLVAIGCLQNGRLLAPGQTLIVDDTYYICTPQTNGNVKLDLAGCVGDNNQLVPLEEILKIESFAFKCTMKEGKPFLAPYACLYNNKTYLVDNFAVEGLLMHVCRAANKTMRLETHGCLDHGMQMKENEIFHNDGFIYKCVKKDGYLQSDGIGCLEVSKKNIVEHMVGEKWLESKEKEKYLVQCAKDEFGVYKKRVQCYFVHDDIALYVDPGCMKKMENYMYQCIKMDDRSLRSMSVINPTQENESIAKTAGLTYCD